MIFHLPPLGSLARAPRFSTSYVFWALLALSLVTTFGYTFAQVDDDATLKTRYVNGNAGVSLYYRSGDRFVVPLTLTLSADITPIPGNIWRVANKSITFYAPNPEPRDAVPNGISGTLALKEDVDAQIKSVADTATAGINSLENNFEVHSKHLGALIGRINDLERRVSELQNQLAGKK